MANPGDFVTGAEFGRFRADFQAFQNRLEERLEHGFSGMNQRLDGLNGRTRHTEQAIAVVERRLGAIESEDSAIETAVEDIKAHGCAQFSEHRAVVDTLGWSTKRKAATAGGLLGVGVLIWPAVQELAAAIHALLDKIP